VSEEGKREGLVSEGGVGMVKGGVSGKRED
jgi:hypothetical protein